MKSLEQSSQVAELAALEAMFELGWGRIRYYHSLCIFSFSQQCIQCRLGHSKAVSHSSGVAYDQFTRSSHMFCVEAFAARIKIESSNQSPFGGLINGSK